MLPPVSGHGPSAASIEAWQTIRSSRMIIYSALCAAAAHHDQQGPTREVSKTREMLALRGEALRLINKDLSKLRKGGRPSDALLFSVMSLGLEPVWDPSPSTSQ